MDSSTTFGTESSPSADGPTAAGADRHHGLDSHPLTAGSAMVGAIHEVMPISSVGQDLGPAEVAHLLIRIERGLVHRLNAILQAERCSVDRWQALLLLADGRGHAMSELVAHTVLPPATVTRLVDGMVASSLAYRRVDETDRRRVLVFATQRGHDLHARLGARIEQHRREVFPVPVSEAGLRALANVAAAMDAPSA